MSTASSDTNGWLRTASMIYLPSILATVVILLGQAGMYDLGQLELGSEASRKTGPW